MASITNPTPLNTYLAAPISGGAAVTAQTMVTALTPIAYDLNNDGVRRYGLNPTTVSTLGTTQNKYNALVNGGGISTSDVQALTLQSVKELRSAIIPLIVSVPIGGVLSVDLTPYGFTQVPVVIITPQEMIDNNITSACIAGGITTANVTIKAYRSQTVPDAGGNPALKGGTVINVHVLIISRG